MWASVSRCLSPAPPTSTVQSAGPSLCATWRPLLPSQAASMAPPTRRPVREEPTSREGASPWLTGWQLKRWYLTGEPGGSAVLSANPDCWLLLQNTTNMLMTLCYICNQWLRQSKSSRDTDGTTRTKPGKCAQKQVVLVFVCARRLCSFVHWTGDLSFFTLPTYPHMTLPPSSFPSREDQVHRRTPLHTLTAQVLNTWNLKERIKI